MFASPYCSRIKADASCDLRGRSWMGSSRGMTKLAVSQVSLHGVNQRVFLKNGVVYLESMVEEFDCREEDEEIQSSRGLSYSVSSCLVEVEGGSELRDLFTSE
jgi:hypothetical protein